MSCVLAFIFVVTLLFDNLASNVDQLLFGLFLGKLACFKRLFDLVHELLASLLPCCHST